MTTVMSMPQGGNSDTEMLAPGSERSPSGADRESPTDTLDIMIGLLTLNNAGSIEAVLKSIVEGLRQFFPDASALLVNCDAGSQDDTSSIISRLAEGVLPVRIVSNPAGTYAHLTREPGFPGRDESIHNFCLTAQRLRPKICLIVEGQLRSLSPAWIDHLGRPVYEHGEDYVVPLYRRHRYEGTLATNLLYPLTRALYGKRLRYPSGGAYGLSGKFAGDLISRRTWRGTAAKYSVDSRLTAAALAGGYRVCHTCLGTREQETKLGAVDLSVVLAQTVGGIFHSMEEYESSWETIKESSEVPLYGEPESAPDPGPLHTGRMVSGFKQGLRDLLPLWELILSRDTVGQIIALDIQDPEEFRFPPALWVQTVYDFALAFHNQTLHREHMLKALTPLYLGRTASFVLETQHGDSSNVERTVEKLCREFEVSKSYLMEQWRWRDE
ncbi:MAG: Glycosyl transferase family 2 [Nitrospira sp.]|nr:MAG: Glycosyl transferase family 2 [Nitrospira sp.]